MRKLISGLHWGGLQQMMPELCFFFKSVIGDKQKGLNIAFCLYTAACQTDIWQQFINSNSIYAIILQSCVGKNKIMGLHGTHGTYVWAGVAENPAGTCKCV